MHYIHNRDVKMCIETLTSNARPEVLMHAYDRYSGNCNPSISTELQFKSAADVAHAAAGFCFISER